MAPPPANSRDAITPDAFRVADHLVGLPLAQPAQRLGAILIDLLLVGILVALLDAVGFLLGLVGAFFVFRLSRAREGRWYNRFYRRGLGCFGAVLTFIVFIVAFDVVSGLFDGGDEDEPETTLAVDSAGNIEIEGVGWTTGAFLLRDGVALGNATSAGERDTLADALVARALAEGVSLAQLRQAFRDLGGDSVFPPAALVALEAAVETAAARAENRPPRSAEQIEAVDSMRNAAAAAADLVAQATRDSLERAQPELAAARDSLRALRARLAELTAELARERGEREQLERRLDQGAVRWVMSSVSDELGLGLGWLGLYFTAFTVLGAGQTPGKRMFRLRVIRLDGRPIGWWQSLQRFGGYSASVLTGLLGFAEILWDDNRQALQDKLVHTVVIREPKKPAASERASATPEVAAPAGLRAARDEDGGAAAVPAAAPTATADASSPLADPAETDAPTSIAGVEPEPPLPDTTPTTDEPGSA